MTRVLSFTRLALFTLVGLALLSLSADSTGEPREIVLVARNMAFYQQDLPDVPNPRLVFHAGDRVRIVLRNDEAGMLHDFAVPTWDARTATIRGRGTATLDLHVPPRPGTYRYICTPHAGMMNGLLEVK